MTKRQCGLGLLGLAVSVAVASPVVSPHSPTAQFRDFLYAPPMRVHLFDDAGSIHAPFVYPLTLVDRVARRFEEDRSYRRPLVWFRGGKLVQVSDPEGGPLLLLGGDPLGRDVFSRLVWGARASLGVALSAALVALVSGAIWGGAAGAVRGWVDETLMRVADFVLVLPALYVVLALRAVTPLVLSPAETTALMVGVFAVIGAPYVARGVRAIVLSESEQDYALAAKGIGVGSVRLLGRHLLPASYGFLATQATLLIPGFILAEATLSFVGLGFANPSTSWGVMLQEASNVRSVVDAPWLLSPALAVVIVVLAINLVARTRAGTEPLVWVSASTRVDRSR